MKKEKNMKSISCLFLCMAVCLAVVAGTIHVRAADEEARIGSTYYDTLEEAFENVQAGDTITVLKDCSVSKTLETSKTGVTLTSADPDNPVVIKRAAGFEYKSYWGCNTHVLLAVTGGSLTMQDIILDGGACLTIDLIDNTGDTTDSPLLFIRNASVTTKEGTVFRNNYNTDGNNGNNTGRSPGAIYVMSGSSLTVEDILIRRCYTNGAGGGIYTASGSTFTATGGTVEECYAFFGGAIDVSGASEISGMTVKDNRGGGVSGMGVYGEATITDCLFEGNTGSSDSGCVTVYNNNSVTFSGCTFTGNKGSSTSVAAVSGYNRTRPVTFKDCTFTDNTVTQNIGAGAVIRYSGQPQIILDGKTVWERNKDKYNAPCCIYYTSGSEGTILLGPDFTSTSTFSIYSSDFAAGKKLVDAETNGITVGASQFQWKYANMRTLVGEDGNVYLAEPLPKYYITYYTNNLGGELSGSMRDSAGYTSERPATVKGSGMLQGTMANHVFDGWNTAWDMSGTDYSEGDTITLSSDMNLYARWTRNKYTLTFDYKGGSGASASLTADLGVDTILPDATREGYIFKGWYADEELTDKAGDAGDGYRSDTEMTLYASWEQLPPEYTVTYDGNGGTPDKASDTVETGTSITLPDCTKEGFTFIGWYDTGDEELCIGQSGDRYTVTEDITLKAHFVSAVPVYRTVTYDADGGECRLLESRTAKGSAITLPDCTKEGYTFTGWYTADETPVKAGSAGDSYTVNADVTLKAHFDENPPVYVTITFDAKGGTTPEPIQAVQWDTVVLPETAREGYVFKGWFAEESCINRLGGQGADMKAAMDMTVYAGWERNAPTTYTVTFDPGEGTLDETTVTVTKGGQVTLPLPMRSGYTFEGWCYDESFTRIAGKAGDKYTVSSDVTLYAKWAAEVPKEPIETYTVTFDARGGTVEKSSIRVAKGKKIRLPKASKEGYLLSGWYDSREICVGNAGDTYRPDDDMTLHARWQTPEKNDPEYGTKEPVVQTGYDSPAPYFLLLASAGILISLGAAFLKFPSGHKKKGMGIRKNRKE